MEFEFRNSFTALEVISAQKTKGGISMGTGDIETNIGVSKREEKAYQRISQLRSEEKKRRLSPIEQEELASLRRSVNPLPPR